MNDQLTIKVCFFSEFYIAGLTITLFVELGRNFGEVRKMIDIYGQNCLIGMMFRVSLIMIRLQSNFNLYKTQHGIPAEGQHIGVKSLRENGNKMEIFLQTNLSPNISGLFHAKWDLLLAFMAKNNGHQNFT